MSRYVLCAIAAICALVCLALVLYLAFITADVVLP